MVNWRRLTRWIPFPAEVVSQTPRLVWHGCESLLIEQHRGIVNCQKDCMSFRTACGLIHVQGQGLELQRYGPGYALVKGEIAGVSYPEEEKHGTVEKAASMPVQSRRPEP